VEERNRKNGWKKRILRIVGAKKTKIEKVDKGILNVDEI
jgi:hypothetical protein